VSAAGSLKNPLTARLEVPTVVSEIEYVFAVLVARIRGTLTRAAAPLRAVARDALRPAPVVSGLIHDLFRSRENLLAENALLRQQLIVASRKVKQPKFRPLERGLVVGLSTVVKSWQNAILLVKPDTVLRWHREGFRLLWARKSKVKKPRQPRIGAETVALIRDMAARNKTWGAERIRGELLKLGIRVAKRTIQRYIRAARPPGDGQRWRTFLRNHTVWACDYLQVYDVWFRPLFAFFIIDVNTREVVHVAVTRAPSARWTAQRLRNVTPYGTGPAFVVRDNDNKFGAEFDRVVESLGGRIIKTPIRAPKMNATCERFLGSVRRECLDHIMILGERHLRSVLAEYVAHFNAGRPHQGIAQRVSSPRADHGPDTAATIVATPILGGLHHEYRRAA
jgi:transposase InsO family protein